MKAAALVVVLALAAASPATAAPEPPPAVKAALQKAWGKGREYRIARCVAWHESGYGLREVSSTGDYGLMQINRDAHGGYVDFGPRIFALAYNVAVARRIYDSARRAYGWPGRWRPWVAYASSCSGVT